MASLSDFFGVIEGATTEELREFSDILRKKLVISFCLGNRVQFDGGYRGIIKGEIVKINPKTIAVRADNGIKWKVSPSLLTKI